MSRKVYFDVAAFMDAIEVLMNNRQISWYRLQKETGINQMVLMGLKHRTKRLSIDTLSALAMWSGLDVRRFMKRHSEVGK